MKLPEPPLLVITDRHRSRRPLEEVAAAVFAAGCRWLSLREKDLAPAARLELLARLIAVGKPWNACVGVHADVAAALATRAGALHLPAGSSPAAARARLGADALLGISAHAAAEVRNAAAAGVDYVTLSPIFPSLGKPGYGPALGPAALARVAGVATVPIVALGGIDLGNAAACIAAGAAGIAVMGAVMAAEDPAPVVGALIERLARGPCPPRQPSP